MKKFLLFLPLIFVVCGCAKLQHLDQLLTLKAVSDNHAIQKKYVHQQNDNFKKILEATKNNSITNYSDKGAIARFFGEPVLTKEVERDGQKCQRWLYRRADKLVDAEKIYLYFDTTGKMIHWEYIPGKPTVQSSHEVNSKS